MLNIFLNGDCSVMVSITDCDSVGEGSNPFNPPLGVVAQLVRALPCHGRGCGFESRQLRIFKVEI
jgi:hypothetical protein